MGKLKLSFYKDAFLHEPTKAEVFELEGLVQSAAAIIEALGVYGREADKEKQGDEVGGVVTSVCRALGLLLEPVEEYFFNEWAGDKAPQEPEQAEQDETKDEE